MAKGVNLRDELRDYKFEFNLLQKIPCARQENEKYKELLKNGDALPEGVHEPTYEYGETDFYTISEADLTEGEIREYLTYKQLRLLKTIKNCAVFFTVLTILGMAAYFIMAMIAL